MSAPINKKKRRGRWSAIQLFVLDELPVVGVVVGALAATISAIVPGLGAMTKPAVASVVVGVALRVLRMRYDLAALSKQVSSDVGNVGDQVGELRQAVVSPDLHRAEKCSRPQFYRHMLDALESAERTVDLTQLDSHAPPHYGTPTMVAYFNRVRQIVSERPNVQFRRIVAVPTLAKLEWLVGILEANVDRPNFQISVFDLPPRDRPAPLSLQIFDRQELCLVDPTVGAMLPGEQENMLWISGSGVADVFSIYYNDLWSKSTPLKEGPLIDFKLLHQILAGLRQAEPHERELATELGTRIRTLADRRTLLAEAG